MENASWLKLAVMTVLSFISMYVLMYIMVDKFADVYPSFSRVYMAGSMTAAMVAIELVVMSSMYKNATVRNVLIGASIILMFIFIAAFRSHTAIGDTDFLRSMIPHHSGAILMCENPNLSDPEIKTLCQKITKSQQEEIAEMKSILERFDR